MPRSALIAGTAVSGLLALGAGPAMALSGDAGIASSAPFRLNADTLEPGCFIGSRLADYHIDLSHLDDGQLATELHISVGNGSPVSVDQVLVPSKFDGYALYDKFDTGTVDNDADIDPNQTAVDMFAPDSNNYDGPDPVDVRNVIVCVSDHGAGKNVPYVSEARGQVAALNRPVLVPQVTALGVSAIEPLNTYKMGFGYSVDKWYSAPSFDGASAFATVTDPNAVPSPTFGGLLPAFVRLNPREDGEYDARRVNDVDSAGEDWAGARDDYGQTRKFKATGDLTAWSLSNNNDPDTLAHLITFTAQGDLPVSWTLRPSLAPHSYWRTIKYTDDELRAWEASWQAYYAGGAKPIMPLAPGTNSPAPRTSVIVNLPESRPASGAAQAPVSTTTNTTIAVTNMCVSNRTVKMAFSKKATSGRLRFNGKTVKAKRSHGRLRATADFRGMKVAPGSYITVVMRSKVHGKWSENVRLFKAC